MQQRNFIVFINPISGTQNKLALRTLIENTLSKNNFAYQILPTEKSGNYTFLKDKVASEKITDIIICGGDGSISQVTSHLLHINVQVGIIPMGSGNGLAFTAGIAKAPKKALDIIINGKASYIDAFWANKQFGCHNIGVGFDAKIAHDFSVDKKRGPSTYIKLVAKNYFKAKAHRFEVVVNDTKLEVMAFFISILNSNQFGNRLTIAPRASLSDGLLDVVVVKKANKFDIFFKVMYQLKAGKVVSENSDKKTIHYFQTKKIHISNPEKVLMHIDGEPVKTSAVIEIEIIEKAFLLLQP